MPLICRYIAYMQSYVLQIGGNCTVGIFHEGAPIIFFHCEVSVPRNLTKNVIGTLVSVTHHLKLKGILQMIYLLHSNLIQLAS